MGHPPQEPQSHRRSMHGCGCWAQAIVNGWSEGDEDR